MKVKDLIKRLKEAPQDMEILSSIDCEGNNFKSIENVYLSDGRKYMIIYPTDECYDYEEKKKGGFYLTKIN